MIRNIDLNLDFSTISNWWKSYNKIELNKRLLPNNGKDGLVAVVDNKIVAAVFMYKTNSPVWYCDFLVADPNYKKENRKDIIINLIDSAVQRCFDNGAEAAWCTTPYDSVLEKLQKLDYIIGKEKHNIIYKIK